MFISGSILFLNEAKFLLNSNERIFMNEQDCQYPVWICCVIVSCIQIIPTISASQSVKSALVIIPKKVIKTISAYF